MGAAVSCKKDEWSCGSQFQKLLVMSNQQTYDWVFVELGALTVQTCSLA